MVVRLIEPLVLHPVLEIESLLTLQCQIMNLHKFCLLF